MLIQLEVSNTQDVELILNLARRLNIPFSQMKSPDVVNGDDRANRIQRILKFKSGKPSSFGDALEWQKNERNDRELPFDQSK